MARKRSLDWCGVVLFSSSRTTNGSTEQEICTASELNAKYTDPTVRRIVGNLWVNIAPTGGGSATTNSIADVYLGIIPQDVTNTTPPAIETGDGWNRNWLWTHYTFVQTRVVPIYTTMGAGGQGALEVRASEAAATASQLVHVDTRVMRRLERFESLSLIIGIAGISASTTVNVRGALRALISE